MKKKDTRKCFFSSMGITLCFCLVGGMFLTADYNNRKLSGKSVISESSLVQRLNDENNSEEKPKEENKLLEKVIFPLEEIIAQVSDRIMEFISPDG